MINETTIAAISTGLTPAGICIVRMSGKNAVRIADTVYRSVRGRKKLSSVKSHTIHYGFIHDGETDLDEVLVSVMRSPHTYTGEDVVEINCHGGLLVAEKVLELLIGKGAVPAEPGEFTKRAFLNGRLDLSRAEAVIDLIDAGNEFALKASVSQLKGAVSRKVRELRETLLDSVSFIEAALDDPEHYELSGYGEELREIVQTLRAEIREMIRKSDDGIILKEGIRTAIAGRPNAGKSSLLNILAGFEKAIVTEIPGTTRDVLEVPVSLSGVSLILLDTAGIRDTEDRVEKIGVERARDAVKNADLVLYLIDRTEGVREEDLSLLLSVRKEHLLVLLNKSDLTADKQAETLEILSGIGIPENQVLSFSALKGEGLQELSERIKEMFHASEIAYNDQTVITNVRQKALLQESEDALSLVLDGIADGISEEFLSVDLMNAYTALGKIIGEEVEDDVIDRVFEKFCMGK